MRGRRRRRPKVLIGAVLLLVVVLGFTLLTGGEDATPGEPVGQRIDAAGTLRGSVVRVRMPHSVYRIVVTTPRSSLNGKETFGGVARETVQGATFVGLSFAAGKEAGTPRELLDAAFQEEPGPVEIALRSGGRSYPIEVDGPTGKQWTAVAGTGEDLQVAVAFDGVTQVFDVGSGIPLPGPADPLYDTDRRVNAPRRCSRPRPRRGDLQARFLCQVRASGQVSYLDELGWAETGTSYAVVDLTTILGRLRNRDVDRDYKRLRVVRRVRLDGAAPLRTRNRTRRGGRVYVFESDFGAPMELTMRLRLTGRRIDSRTAPQRASLRLKRKLGLRG